MRKIHANVIFMRYSGYLFGEKSGYLSAKRFTKKEKLRPPIGENRSFFVPIILPIN
jgi:hypothetical protein